MDTRGAWAGSKMWGNPSRDSVMYSSRLYLDPPPGQIGDAPGPRPRGELAAGRRRAWRRSRRFTVSGSKRGGTLHQGDGRFARTRARAAASTAARILWRSSAVMAGSLPAARDSTGPAGRRRAIPGGKPSGRMAAGLAPPARPLGHTEATRVGRQQSMNRARRLASWRARRSGVSSQ
jgi:hypothetical protein